MPLPIKLRGRLPKKGHMKTESVHPTSKSGGWEWWDQHIWDCWTTLSTFPFRITTITSFPLDAIFTGCRERSTESHQVVSRGPLSRWAAGRCECHVCLRSHSALGLVSDNRGALLSRISSHVLHLIHSVYTGSLPDGWLTCILSEFLLLRIQTRASQGLGILSLHLFYVLASQEDFVEFYIL